MKRAHQGGDRGALAGINRALLVTLAGWEPGRMFELQQSHDVIYVVERGPDGTAVSYLRDGSTHRGICDRGWRHGSESGKGFAAQNLGPAETLRGPVD